MLKVIGLTGGIGSGKSTAARMFESLNVPIYNADKEAKNLMNKDASLKSGIKQLFGEKAYLNNKLNREFIAGIVFKNKDMLQTLNSLVHPEVRKHFLAWVASQSSSYVIQENPLIFEKNDQYLFDKVILVTADKQQRIDRVMHRDNVTEVQVLERMSNQLNDELKTKLADFVIYNDTIDNMKTQVLEIHHLLIG